VSAAEKKAKRVYCYIASFIVSFFMLLLIWASVISQWHVWVNIYAYVVIAILMGTAISHKVSDIMQSYIVTTISFVSLFMIRA